MHSFFWVLNIGEIENSKSFPQPQRHVQLLHTIQFNADSQTPPKTGAARTWWEKKWSGDKIGEAKLCNQFINSTCASHILSQLLLLLFFLLHFWINKLSIYTISPPAHTWGGRCKTIPSRGCEIFSMKIKSFSSRAKKIFA